MKRALRTLSLCFILALPAAAADIFDAEGNISGWDPLLSRVKVGTVVVFSDTHGYVPHHDNQRDFLVRISPLTNPVSVGLEFFEFPHQSLVDGYTRGELAEEKFLAMIGWGGIPFGNYRFQALFPSFLGGRAVAINCPRSITGKIARTGVDSLTEEERAYLPADFQLGTETYYERFADTMRDHVPEEAIARYFAAHSAWDDTMAWQTARFMRNHPDHTFVIIVGDFHVSYRDGLVARLKARGIQDVLVLSQVDTAGLSEDERMSLIKPHPRYGSRADFIFETR